MRKISVILIIMMIIITAYPTLANNQDVEKKSDSYDQTSKEIKKHFSCYVEIEGVWENHSKIMYWRFPYIGEGDKCFVFWWNISFPYKDAIISVYRNNGGELLYERNDLEAVRIFFFIGTYDSTHYYLTIKGNVFMVESD